MKTKSSNSSSGTDKLYEAAIERAEAAVRLEMANVGVVAAQKALNAAYETLKKADDDASNAKAAYDAAFRQEVADRASRTK